MLLIILSTKNKIKNKKQLSADNYTTNKTNLITNAILATDNDALK
jgi:hypothetical protein